LADADPHPDERFPKADRLLRRSEFKKTGRRGTRRSSRHFVVYATPGEPRRARLGITVSRKVGKAHRRNRWKRRIREIFRRNKSEIPIGYDYVVIVKRPRTSHEPDFARLREELLRLLNEAART